MMTKRILVGLAAFMAAFAVQADAIMPNALYRIVNANYTTRSLAASGAVNTAVTLPNDENDLKQLWYVTSTADGRGYFLRNVANGAYLTSPMQLYTNWPMSFVETPTPTNMAMAIEDLGDNKTIRALGQTGTYPYAHNDASNNVVCWQSSSVPSQWKFQLVEKSEAEMQELIDHFTKTADEIAKASVYQVHLDALFADAACTKLKDGIDLTNNADYQALSTPLKRMVDKVSSGDWSETSGNWNSKYAKKYRVQLYEPYSEGSAGSGMAGIQAYTNMNNPTGILGDANDIMYVIVGDDIPAGATLYISGAPDGGMYNSVNAGTQLHKGLNMVMCNNDNLHYFIYYTVNSIQNGKPTQYKVTEFPSLKIHIEGGRLNGFFNYVGDDLYKGDTREDYEYTSSRATHMMYDLIGKYVILHFFLEDTPDTVDDVKKQKGVKSSLDPSLNPGTGRTYDPVEIMKSWDKMCFAERILMGIQSDKDIADEFNRGMYSSIVGKGYQVGNYVADPGFQYSDYFNNKMMGITLQAKGLYMNATAWRTAYAPSTVGEILTMFPAGNIWGPAHEYGHMNQTPMRIAGTTEESNNVFSNVALYFCDHPTTSRSDFLSSQLKIFNQGKTFLEHGTWGTTRMFWQLWLYYHATKHNTEFYPRLYELLRKNSLRRDMTSIPGKLNPRYDMLQFAKMCCVAAGEDLTNFFTAWGFFVPLDNYHIDDYDVYDCVLTPEDIAAVKQEIADFHFEPNNAIILIDDRPGSELPTHGEFNKSKGGDLGGLAAFTNGAPVGGDLSFTIDGTTVTVNGDGTDGVGFLVFDKEGNLIGFSNSYNFDLSPEAIEALLAGEATISAISDDNKEQTVTNVIVDGSPEDKRALLQQLIETCDELLSDEDEEGVQIGMLYSDYCGSLKALKAEAEALVADESASGEELGRIYIDLSAEYLALSNNDEARIKVVPGAAYRIGSFLYPGYSLSSNGQTCVSAVIDADHTATPFNQQWIFEPSADGAGYYLKNMANGRYIDYMKAFNVTVAMTDTPQKYTPVNIGKGVMALYPDNATGYALHMNASHSILHWNYTSSDGSRWRSMMKSSAEYVRARQALIDKVNQAESLLNEAGSVVGLRPYTMKFTDDLISTNAQYTGSTAADQLKSWQVLFDGNVGTYFHSNYNGENSTDGLDHYIQFKAPGDDTFRFFNISYTTRNSSDTGTMPRKITIQGSIDGNEWTDLLKVTSGLPLGAALSYTTPEIEAQPGTKYIRFQVNESGGARGGHAYFVVSEMKIANRQDLVYTPNPQYPKVQDKQMANVGEDVIAAENLYNSAETTEEELTEALGNITVSHNALLAAMQGIVPVESLTLSADRISILMEDTADLLVTVGPEDATDTSLEWSVEPEGIVEIVTDASTLSASIEAKSVGTATITISSTDGSGIQTQCLVNVMPIEVTALSLSLPENVVKVGDEPVVLTAEVTPSNATSPRLVWEVGNPTKASIEKADATTALLTPLAMGLTDITVRLEDNEEISAKTTLKILPDVPVNSITLNPSQLTVPANATDVVITADISPANAFDTALKWESSDHDVAVVNENTGVITLMGEGTTVITASSTDGTDVSATCELTVTAPVAQGLVVTPSEASVEVGSAVQLAAGYYPENVQSPEIVWSTENTDIVHVEQNGMITAIAPGEATVKASASVGGSTIEASAKITVLPVSLKVLWFETVTPIQMEEGTTMDVYAGWSPLTVDPQLLWSADDEKVIEIIDGPDPASATIRALRAGTTMLNLQSGSNPELSAVCQVDVTEGIVEIRLVVDNPTMALAEGSRRVTAVINPSTAVMPDLTWNSSNPDIAIVENAGNGEAIVTPLKVGKTTIAVAHVSKPDVGDSSDIEVVDATTAISELFGTAHDTVDVYDLNGRVIRLKATSSDLERLTPGIYILRQGDVSKKVLIK